MLNFIHDIPTKLYFGKGQICHLAESLMQYGKRVLLAYGGGSIKRMGLYDEVMEILNGHDFIVTELSGIAPNPRLSSVAEGQRLCRENGVDVILAVGGAAQHRSRPTSATSPPTRQPKSPCQTPAACSPSTDPQGGNLC